MQCGKSNNKNCTVYEHYNEICADGTVFFASNLHTKETNSWNLFQIDGMVVDLNHAKKKVMLC